MLAVLAGPVGWCLAVGALVGGDPLLAIELVGAALVVLWAALVAWDLAVSHRLAKALSVRAQSFSAGTMVPSMTDGRPSR